jgi:hypothetical protein
MSSKIDRALHGPSWAEVILGALLSFVLGVALAAGLLVIKPVQAVKELPKEPARDVVYYVEGSHDPVKGRPWSRKRQQLVAGQSISLNDDELNAVIPPPVPEKPAPTPAKGAPPAPVEPPPSGFVVGTPNFHLLTDELQIAVPCTLNVLGTSQQVMVIATGQFKKEDDVIYFAPNKFYVGSLDITRLPGIPAMVTDKLLGGQGIPVDLVDAWAKLSDVTVEPNTLRLTMP